MVHGKGRAFVDDDFTIESAHRSWPEPGRIPISRPSKPMVEIKGRYTLLSLSLSSACLLHVDRHFTIRSLERLELQQNSRLLKGGVHGNPVYARILEL